jgi:hypothetical protein
MADMDEPDPEIERMIMRLIFSYYMKKRLEGGERLERGDVEKRHVEAEATNGIITIGSTIIFKHRRPR